MSKIVQIIQYQTSDGRLFDTHEQAEEYEKWHKESWEQESKRLNEILENYIDKINYLKGILVENNIPF